MNKRQFDDDSRALSAPVPCGSIVHAMPVSTTKIRASANRSSHPHHRNSQRFESLRCRHIHIAEPIWTDSLVRTRYSGSQRLEPFRNGRLHNRKPCFAGSTASHSPSKFTAIRVPVPPTYPHPEPRFDGSLADGRRSASQQSRAFSQPTSAHRKPCLAMRLLSLTVATHSESTLLAAAMPTSKPYTSGRHRASNRAKIRATRQCAQRLQISRAPASRFASTPPLTDKNTALRVPSTPTYPHTRPTSSPTPTRFIVESRQPRPIAGNGYYPRNAPAARAHTLRRPNMPAWFIYN